MAISNDERRKVAARLRVLASHAPADAEMVLDALDLYEGEYIEGFEPRCVDRLADLIEPEPERTCRMEPNERGYVVCSNCGEEMSAYTCEWTEPMEYSYQFCYACGAKVVGE